MRLTFVRRRYKLFHTKIICYSLKESISQNERGLTLITETMLTCFLVLRRTLNFTKAAAELYMTQQSVSQNISKLEADLGLKLFQRDTHSVRLTECGELYAQQLEQMTRQHRALISELRLNYASGAPFRVGLSDHPDFNFLARALQANADTLLPGHTVELSPLPPANLFTGLQKQKLDIIFTLDRYVPRREGLITCEVMRINMALHISRKHPAYSENATFEAFSSDPLVIKGHMHEDRYYSSNEYIAQEVAQAGITPSGIIMVNDALSALSVAGAGGGVLLGTMASKYSEEYNLAPIPIPGYEAVFLGVWHDYTTGPLHQMFCDHVSALCAAEFSGNK